MKTRSAQVQGQSHLTRAKATSPSLLASFVKDSDRLLAQAEEVLIQLEGELLKPAGLPSSSSCVRLFATLHALRGMASLLPEGQGIVGVLAPLEHELMDRSARYSKEGRFQDLKLSFSTERIRKSLISCQKEVRGIEVPFAPESVTPSTETPHPESSSVEYTPPKPLRKEGGLRLQTESGEVQLPLKWVLAIESQSPPGLDWISLRGADHKSCILRQGRWVPVRSLCGEQEPGVWILMGKDGVAESYLGGIRILGFVQGLGDEAQSLAG